MKQLITALICLLSIQIVIPQNTFHLSDGKLSSKITTIPAGASLFINGKNIGVTPLTITGIRPKMRISITLEKEGYLSPTIPLRGGVDINNYPLKKPVVNAAPTVSQLRNKYSYVGAVHDGVRLVRDRESGLFGFLDPMGGVVVECQFYNASLFNSMNLAQVRMADKSRGLINPRGEFIAPVAQYEYLACDSVRQVIFKKINKRLSILNPKGEPLTDVRFDRYTSLSSPNTIALYAGKRCALLVGDSIVWTPYTKIVVQRENNLLATAYIGDMVGLINDRGEQLIAPQYDNIYIYNDIERVIAYKNGKASLLSISGEVLTSTTYDNIYNFADGVAICKIDDKYGVIGVNGEAIAAPTFLFASNYASGIAVAKIAPSEYLFIDCEGCELFGRRFRDASGFTREGAAMVLDEENQRYFIGVDGLPIDSIGYDHIDNERKSGITSPFRVVIDEKFGYVGLDGRAPDTLPYDFASTYNDKYGVAVVRRGGEHYIIDTLQQRVTERNYDYIRPFESGDNPITVAQRDDKMGFITTTGTEIEEFRYNMIDEFNDHGVAQVHQGDLMGYVDRSGREIIEVGRYRSLFVSALQDDTILALTEQGEWVVWDSGDEQPANLANHLTFNDKGVALIPSFEARQLSAINRAGEIIGEMGVYEYGAELPTLRDGELTNLYNQSTQECLYLGDDGRVRLGQGKGWQFTSAFNSGIALTCKIQIPEGNVYQYINERGEAAFDTSLFDRCRNFNNGQAVVRDRESGHWGTINPRGRWVIKPQFSDEPVWDNLVNGEPVLVVEIEGERWVVNLKGKRLGALSEESNEP